MHYYKFNIADWSLSTAHLSLEEEAIYFRLINHYYDTQLPIPLETQSVIRRLRLGSEEKTTAILDEFFIKSDNGWTHKRCEKVLKEYRKTAKKNKINGLKGGRPSNNAASSVTQTKPSGLPNESQNNPNQEPLTKNHKPLTTNQLKRGFTPPSVDQVKEYCLSRHNSVDPPTFIDHYETNGWMRGKNKIKDWKACVRTWEKTGKKDWSGMSKTEQLEESARNAGINTRQDIDGDFRIVSGLEETAIGNADTNQLVESGHGWRE